MNGTTTHSLPEDIMILIMSKLPIKSLLRFKSFSKRWYTLITTDSHLTNTHLDHSNNNKLCIAVAKARINISRQPEEIMDRMLLLRDESTHEDLHLDHHPVDQRFDILGSCNGLVCVRLSDPHRNSTNIMLWNPATKDSRYLPEPAVSLLTRGPNSNMVSFGFDQNNKDYKLVLVELSNIVKICEGTIFRVQVFRQSSNSWRQVVNDLSDKIKVSVLPKPVILNGVAYFRGHDNHNGYTIFSFNLCSEKFDHEIRPPRKYDDKFSLCEWKDSLTLMDAEKEYPGHNFWVKGDNYPGTKNHSWTKLIKINVIGPSGDYDYLLHFTGVWNKGFLFIKHFRHRESRELGSHAELISIDLFQNQTIILEDIGKEVTYYYEAFDYVESLVSVYP